MYLTTAFKNNSVYSLHSSRSVCTTATYMYNYHNSDYDTDSEEEEEQKITNNYKLG